MTAEARIPPELLATVRKMIAYAIAEYARSGPLRNARISGGAGLTIADGGRFRANYPVELGGGEMLYVGDIYSTEDGSYQGTGLLLQAPDGTDLMVMRTDTKFGTTMQNIYDSAGRIIFGNDAASGQGLARPWLSGGFSRVRYGDMSVSTTSSTFETLWDTRISKQHPRLEVAYRASMDTSGATGETRVLVNGVQLGSTLSHSFAIGPNYQGPFAVAGEHMDDLVVEIQGRRTSASGALRVEPMYWRGRQS